MRPSGRKRFIALAISVALLALLIASVDVRELLRVLAGADMVWLGAALLFFLPQTIAISLRWRLIAEPLAPLSWTEAGKQILASNCLNLVLPSKMGDLAKGYFLHRQHRCELADGMQVVVFEKLLDLAALSAWMVLGWALAPRMDWWVLGVLALGVFIILLVITVYFVPRGKSILESLIPSGIRSHRKFGKVESIVAAGPRVMALIHADTARRARIIAWSFLIWLLHLAQIYCFFRTLHAVVTPFDILARMPIAIFAGLLPLTIAGVGTRDWALVTIFASAANPRELLVGVGFLVSLRYVIPALGGLPWVGPMMTAAKEAGSPIDAQPSG